MKVKTKKKGKLGAILFFSGLVCLCIGLALENSVPKGTIGYFFSGFITVLGVVTGVIGLIQLFMGLSYGSTKEGKEDLLKRKVEKDAEKKIKEKLFKSMEQYDDAQQCFQYLSDDTLLLIYENFIQKKYKKLERLALEKELVKRGLIKDSPMNDKLYSIEKETFVE